MKTWIETSKEEKKFCRDMFRCRLMRWKLFYVNKQLELGIIRVFWQNARQDAYITFNQE